MQFCTLHFAFPGPCYMFNKGCHPHLLQYNTISEYISSLRRFISTPYILWLSEIHAELTCTLRFSPYLGHQHILSSFPLLLSSQGLLPLFWDVYRGFHALEIDWEWSQCALFSGSYAIASTIVLSALPTHYFYLLTLLYTDYLLVQSFMYILSIL